jgi:hypothetical protein
MADSFDDIIISVWRQALIENAKTVELEGKRFRTARHRSRQVAHGLCAGRKILRAEVSGLRSVKDVKEHQHTEAREHMNQRRQKRHRWHHITHDPQ